MKIKAKIKISGANAGSLIASVDDYLMNAKVIQDVVVMVKTKV